MRDVLQNDHSMKNIAVNPKALAIISLILALPMAVLYRMVILQVEPLHGFFPPCCQLTVIDHLSPMPLT